MEQQEKKTADETANPSTTERKSEAEWKQFIRQELARARTPEEDERKGASDAAAPTELTLGSVMERIPIERLIWKAVGLLTKPEDSKSRKKSKKRRK